MEHRTKDSFQTYVYDFIKFDILVVCPNCSQKAVVKPGHFPDKSIEESDIKLVCPQCGYNKRLVDKPAPVLYATKYKTKRGRFYVIGGPIDPFFYLPLWLRTEFEENTLWAYNPEHLDFLRAHIEARLRQRSGQEPSNRSLGSRLPKWMTAKKNREAVLKKIADLHHKVTGDV